MSNMQTEPRFVHSKHGFSELHYRSGRQKVSSWGCAVIWVSYFGPPTLTFFTGCWESSCWVISYYVFPWFFVCRGIGSQRMRPHRPEPWCRHLYQVLDIKVGVWGIMWSRNMVAITIHNMTHITSRGGRWGKRGACLFGVLLTQRSRPAWKSY